MTALGRRTFLLGTAAQAIGSRPQRVVVVMCDGFGMDYLAASPMPTLAHWKQAGVFKMVRGVMPSVTNANNASICCGAWPAVHGITGNSYWDARHQREEYMESAALVRAPTLFERAAQHGVKSALLSSKKKTTTLLPRGAEVVVAAEAPSPEWVERLGTAPDIYSREINYWLLRAAIDLLTHRRDLGCLYIHTTDYPMHTWAPEASESKEHLVRLDALLSEAASVAPDAAFLVTADHGMHHKEQCLGPGEGVSQPACRGSGRNFCRARPVPETPPGVRRDELGLPSTPRGCRPGGRCSLAVDGRGTGAEPRRGRPRVSPHAGSDWGSRRVRRSRHRVRRSGRGDRDAARVVSESRLSP